MNYTTFFILVDKKLMSRSIFVYPLPLKFLPVFWYVRNRRAR